MAFPVLHWPRGQKSNGTKRGQRLFWALTERWGCTVGPRGLLNIIQLRGQQSLSADIYTHVSSGNVMPSWEGMAVGSSYDSHTNVTSGTYWFGLERHCEAPVSASRNFAVFNLELLEGKSCSQSMLQKCRGPNDPRNTFFFCCCLFIERLGITWYKTWLEFQQTSLPLRKNLTF